MQNHVIQPLRRMDIRDILADEAEKAAIGINDILGPKRTAKISTARHKVMWRLYHDLGMTLSRIAKELHRSRSLVLYAIRKHEGGDAFLGQRRERRYRAMIKTGLPKELKCQIPDCRWHWTVDTHHESVTGAHYLCPNHHSLIHRFKIRISDLKKFAGRYDLLIRADQSQQACSASRNPP